MAIHCMLMGLVLGIDVGWRPLPDGQGTEFLIQLSPDDLDAMTTGEPWMTDIPASVGEVRAYRITVGTGALPRIDPPPKRPPLEETRADPTPQRIDPAGEPKPLPEKQAIYMQPGPEQGDPARTGEDRFPDGTAPDPEKPASRPWMLLVGTALALAGSLGGNAYLLWGLHEMHRRYQELAAG